MNGAIYFLIKNSVHLKERANLVEHSSRLTQEFKPYNFLNQAVPAIITICS